VWGYKGGCELATGSFSQAMRAPYAARYLCDKSLAYDDYVGLVEKNRICLPDFSMGGVCWQYNESWDEFTKGVPVRFFASHGQQPGSSLGLNSF
jgi:hypothetical protein